MSLHTIEDLTSCILDFQANMVRVTYRKKTTLVDPENVAAHNDALSYIWSISQLEVDEDESGAIVQWRKLGFDSEDIIQEFSEVGVLGLDCLVCDFFPRTKPNHNITCNVRETLFKQIRISRG
jgi:engulfment/cell motility protein 1